MQKTNIIVKFDLEGYHKWPGPPEQYKRLGSEHGHIFHFEAHIPVEASRQLEFLDVRHVLMSTIENSYMDTKGVCDFRGMSCEQLAQSLSRSVFNLFNVLPYRVAVYEDQFVGAEVIDG